MSEQYFRTRSLDNRVTKDKGTQIMRELITSQYSNSPLLLQYYEAFTSELDFLFEHVERVYLGRFLEYATGVQLDVIGRILNQSRNVVLPVFYFGFEGAANATKMASKADPQDGGLFRSITEPEYSITPLSDEKYRRLLRVKALCHGGQRYDIEFVYHIIQILLGKTPTHMKMFEESYRQMAIELLATETTEVEAKTILYASKYFMPVSVGLAVNRI